MLHNKPFFSSASFLLASELESIKIFQYYWSASRRNWTAKNKTCWQLSNHGRSSRPSTECELYHFI